jgi:hypothetical protein
MLFDLRSRRRKNAVRVIYIGLAVVMVVGLVLFGVGTGASGLLNNGSGSSGHTGSTSNQVKKAREVVDKNPDSPEAWGKLFEAQMINAQSGANVTGKYNEPTKSGKVALMGAAVSWQKYLELTKQKPSSVYAGLAGKAYTTLALTGVDDAWGNAASAWTYMIQSIPAADRASTITPYECLAITSYAGKQPAKAALAAAQAKQIAKETHYGVALSSELTEALAASKKSTKEASEYALSLCSTMHETTT